MVSGAYRFEVRDEVEALQPLWQPEYDEDFDAAGLDLNAESNETVVVTETAQGDAEGGAQPLHLGPERVFETPQRVWLPIPPGVDLGALQLYYHHAHGDAAGWYPAGTWTAGSSPTAACTSKPAARPITASSYATRE